MFITVNGVTLFYEKQGAGNPIILLHGNGENHTIFHETAALLSETHAVYLPDSRGHGESSKVETLSYADMAEDIALLIQALSLRKPILYGFSDGGIIGLLIAIQYPNLLSKLIISGANTHPSGLGWFFLWRTRLQYFFTRNPNDRLMAYEPNITDEELSSIAIPTLILAGEHDVIRLSHTRQIARHVPHSTLRILPEETHESYVIHSTKLYEYIKDFL
jgi:pimeloyl-ACP methyl ester carboxylesterase